MAILQNQVWSTNLMGEVIRGDVSASSFKEVYQAHEKVLCRFCDMWVAQVLYVHGAAGYTKSECLDVYQRARREQKDTLISRTYLNACKELKS